MLRPYGVPPHTTPAARVRELAQVGRGLWSLRRSVDVVHSFGRLAALAPLLPLRGLPKIPKLPEGDRLGWRAACGAPCRSEHRLYGLLDQHVRGRSRRARATSGGAPFSTAST